MRAPRKKNGRRATATLSARLLSHVTLQAQAGGDIVARFDDVALGLGKFSAEAAERAKRLHVGLPLSTFASGNRETDKEVLVLVRRLAGRGLIEYRLGRSQNEDLVVIEPQLPDYWPRLPQLGNADTLVLSRFAYMRRRANEMVLESPRAGALFKICDPKIAVALALLSTPQQIKQFRRQKDFPGLELLALLVDCQILFKAAGDGLRPAEGDDALVLWDFHDLVFHARSTEGRHANPLGGAYPYADTIAPLPAVRPPWPGTKIDLRELAATAALSPTAALLRERHSTRDFDNQKPITLAELARFLDSTARVQSELKTTLDHGERRRSGTQLHGAALSVGRRQLRARALSGRRQMRRAAARLLSLRCRRPRAGTDRGPRQSAQRAAQRRHIRHGRELRPANPDHHCGALRPGVVEIQFDRLCAHSQGRRRLDANVLRHGDRYGSRRLRDRHHQYRAVRENDGTGRFTSKVRSVNLRSGVARKPEAPR